MEMGVVSLTFDQAVRSHLKLKKKERKENLLDASWEVLPVLPLQNYTHHIFSVTLIV